MEPLINPPPAADLIKDGTSESFMNDVIAASQSVPVLVDFWASWCGPCKQLTPLLERLVTAARGAVKLVKIDVDKNQAISAQLRIQSLPTVMAFVDGRPVDGFTGALPESELKAFIGKILAGGPESGPSPVEQAIGFGQEALAQGEFMRAAQAFGQAVQAEPENIDALTGLARTQMQMGDSEAAKRTLAMVPENKREEAAVKSIRSALELAEEMGENGIQDISALKAALEANQDDHQVRYDLALAYLAADDREACAEALLHIIRRQRDWQEGAARERLLKLFEAYGPTDPFTIAARRKLSAILFA